METFFGRYGKALAATTFAALTALYATSSGDGVVDPDEWVAIAIAAVSAVGVYVVPLAPRYRWTKTAVAALLAGLQVLATVILGGVDANEWLLIAIAIGQALGVAAAPATSDNGVTNRARPAPPAAPGPVTGT
ncbi:hypothetical protein [Micromonospora thermarum]|uniref:Holin n=1 Tax=Micromonospora thermarum TaxID=2720024 RepID=A0ABX0Z7V7_9ACTN|nr:hypothetical protein [Micromonospora thermarum]NJP33553.1 hypothetical protein [Micromonospora thermarum]